MSYHIEITDRELLEFAKKQNRNQSVSSCCKRNCFIAQYLKSKNIEFTSVGDMFIWKGFNILCNAPHIHRMIYHHCKTWGEYADLMEEQLGE